MSWSQRRRLPEPPAPEPPLPAELSPCLPRVVRLQPTCRLRSGPGAARWPPRRPRSLLRSPRCRTSATSRKRSGRSSWPSWIARRKKRRRSSPCSSKDRAPSSRLSSSAPLARAAPLPGAIAASPPVRLGSGATAAAGVARLGVVRAAGGVCVSWRAGARRASLAAGRWPAPDASFSPGARPAGRSGSGAEAEPGAPRAPFPFPPPPRPGRDWGTESNMAVHRCSRGRPGCRRPGRLARPPARGASSRRGPSARAGPSPSRRALPTTAAGRQEGGGGGGAGQGPKRRGVSGGCAAAAIFQPLPPGGCSHPVLALPASLPATAPPARSPARQVLLCLLTVEPARICVFAEGGRRESSSQTVVSRRRNFSTRELSRLSFPRLGDPLSL